MKAYKAIKLYETLPLLLFNCFAKIKYIGARRKRSFLLKNKRLENLESKKSCYILMGGLSVKSIDLNKLVDCDVITANNFFRTEDYERIKPKYHVITDESFFKASKNIEDLRNTIQGFTTLVLNGKHMDPVDALNWHYIYPAFRVINSKIQVDLTRACSNFTTVTLSCIQLAIYLGYKEITLVGFDLPPGRMPHYYIESKSEIEDLEVYKNLLNEYDYCELFWQYTNCHHEAYKIASYAKANGINIYNTSRESYVRAFPYKEFAAP